MSVQPAVLPLITYSDLMSCLNPEEMSLKFILSDSSDTQRAVQLRAMFDAALKERAALTPTQGGENEKFDELVKRYASLMFIALRDTHLLALADSRTEDPNTRHERIKYTVPNAEDRRSRWRTGTEAADLEAAFRANEMYRSLPPNKVKPNLERTRQYLLEQICHYWMHGNDNVSAKAYFTYLVGIYKHSEHAAYRELIVKVIREANRDPAKLGRYEMAMEHLQTTAEYEPLMRVLALGLVRHLDLNQLQKRLVDAQPT